MDNKHILVKEILEFLAGSRIDHSYAGGDDLWIEGFCTIDNLKPHSLMWVKNESKLSDLEQKSPESSVIIAPRDLTVNFSGCGTIYCDNPRQVFFTVLDEFWKKEFAPGVGRSSVVETDKMGDNVSIGENCYISEEVVIGSNVIIGNNVTIMNRAVIGDGCLIHSGVTIGDDGLGMVVGEDGIPHKAQQYGGVCIGNNVEIFTGAIIMRGAIDDTCIGDDCKIGSRVTVGHNVQVGRCTTIMGSTTLCGSVRIGEMVYIGTGTVVRNQICIGSGAFIGMGVLVNSDIEEEAAVISNDRFKSRPGAARFLRRRESIFTRR